MTLNDGTLCRLAVSHWRARGWIVVAPHSPLVAMAGPGLEPDVTLREFCGRSDTEEPPGEAPAEVPPGAVWPEEQSDESPSTEEPSE